VEVYASSYDWREWEWPKARPNPGVEVLEVLPDGTECKAVWSLLKRDGVAKLVTVHFFDEEW
jgi:hypothetical protein